ncbi:Nucleolar protein 12 [Nymphon striatum]|nr:Nucleolar protein 12 [Nymphon striatum]
MLAKLYSYWTRLEGRSVVRRSRSFLRPTNEKLNHQFEHQGNPNEPTKHRETNAPSRDVGTTVPNIDYGRMTDVKQTDDTPREEMYVTWSDRVFTLIIYAVPGHNYLEKNNYRAINALQNLHCRAHTDNAEHHPRRRDRCLASWGDYLKNFKKRKDERKLKAQEQFKKDVKEERKKYKLEQKEKLQEMFASQRTVPEVEHLVDPVKYELPSHTVTISSIENVDLAGHNDLHLGRNIITESPALNKGKNPLLKCKNFNITSSNLSDQLMIIISSDDINDFDPYAAINLWNSSAHKPRHPCTNPYSAKACQ